MSYKLFITGGTGFWGKSLLKLILDEKKYFDLFSEIVVLTRDKEKFFQLSNEFNTPKLNFINGDIRNFELNRIDFDFILHFATDTSKKLNDTKPLEMMDVIINGTKHILEFAKKQTHLQKMVFASSGAVYGNIPDEVLKVNEEQRFDLDFNNPLNAYAQAKRTAEMMCQIYIQYFQVPILIVRGFAFFGKYLPHHTHFAISSFIDQAKEKNKITIQSNGLSIRSFMDATDLSICILELILQKNNLHTIYNIGSEDSKTIKEWANIIANQIGNTTVEILNQPQESFTGKNYIPNIGRLKKFIELNNIILDFNTNITNSK